MNPRLKALELHGYKTIASRFQFRQQSYEIPSNTNSEGFATTAAMPCSDPFSQRLADVVRMQLGIESRDRLFVF